MSEQDHAPSPADAMPRVASHVRDALAACAGIDASSHTDGVAFQSRQAMRPIGSLVAGNDGLVSPPGWQQWPPTAERGAGDDDDDDGETHNDDDGEQMGNPPHRSRSIPLHYAVTDTNEAVSPLHYAVTDTNEAATTLQRRWRANGPQRARRQTTIEAERARAQGLSLGWVRWRAHQQMASFVSGCGIIAAQHRSRGALRRGFGAWTEDHLAKRRMRATVCSHVLACGLARWALRATLRKQRRARPLPTSPAAHWQQRRALSVLWQGFLAVGWDAWRAGYERHQNLLRRTWVATSQLRRRRLQSAFDTWLGAHGAHFPAAIAFVGHRPAPPVPRPEGQQRSQRLGSCSSGHLPLAVVNHRAAPEHRAPPGPATHPGASSSAVHASSSSISQH